MEIASDEMYRFVMGTPEKSKYDYIVYPRPRKVRVRGRSVPEPGWQAAWNVPKELRPPGVDRKRITGTGVTRPAAIEALIENIELFKTGQKKGRTRTVNNTQGLETGYTVETFLMDYIDNYKKNYVHENTYRKYKRDYQRYVIPYVGKKRLEDLTYQDCKKLVLDIWPKLTETKVINGETVKVPLLAESAQRSLNSQLKSALRHGKKKLGLRVNPMDNFPAPRAKPAETIEQVIASREKVAEMFKTMKKDSPDYIRFVLMYLALRPGEKLGLRWRNVSDLFGRRPMLTIEHTLGFSKNRGGYYEDPPKSGVPRKIPIFEPALSALREHYKRTQGWSNLADWSPDKRWGDIILLEKGGVFVSPKSDTNRWRKLMLEHGITLPDKHGKQKHIRQHMMRHITATTIADAEDVFTIEDAQKLLGHSNTAMTYFYARRDPQVLSENLQGFNPLERSLPNGRDEVSELRKRRKA
jgi:integrase